MNVYCCTQIEQLGAALPQVMFLRLLLTRQINKVCMKAVHVSHINEGESVPVLCLALMYKQNNQKLIFSHEVFLKIFFFLFMSQ